MGWSATTGSDSNIYTGDLAFKQNPTSHKPPLFQKIVKIIFVITLSLAAVIIPPPADPPFSKV